MIEVKEEGEFLIVKTPYLPVFVEELKKYVPSADRKFDFGEKVWKIRKKHENLVKRLLTKYFKELKEVLLVAIANGGSPTVGGLKLVSYGVNWHEPTRSQMVHTVEAIRVGHNGSRRNPLFHGYVVARVYLNDNVPVEAYYYRLFECTPENLEKITKFVRDLAEKCSDDLEKAKEELKKFSEVSDEESFRDPFEDVDKILNEVETILLNDRKSCRVVAVLEKVKRGLELRLERVEKLLEISKKR